MIIIRALLVTGLLGAFALAGLQSLAFGHTGPDDGSETVALDEAKINALSFSSASMMPGDSITDHVVVENDGSGELRYTVTASATNADRKHLRDVLTVAIRTADRGIGDGFGEDGDFCDDATGTELRTATAVGASSIVIGDPRPGSQPGDRRLASGESEALCFELALPTSVGNAYQAASTTTTFTFTAEQTSNNP